MSIEIKRWTDDKVIYTAENAQDVREALQEAVGKGADLGYANLRYADLRSANLRYANLRSADPRSANLRSANLRSADPRSANLRSADLRYADLRYANLRSANLGSADLRSADLGYADLRYADLRYANLRSANLGSADLRFAKGVHPARVTPLHILLDQVGKIRAYKLVNADGEGPFNGGITYEVGETVEVADADTDPDKQCGAGINVATLPWCLDNWREGHRVLLVEFIRADIACIPTATDGKFRVRRCKVVREVDVSEIVNPKEDTDA